MHYRTIPVPVIRGLRSGCAGPFWAHYFSWFFFFEACDIGAQAARCTRARPMPDDCTSPTRDREAPSLKAVLEDRVVVPTDYESLVSEYRVWWEHGLELTPPLGDRPWGTGVPGTGPTVWVRLGGGPQGAHFIS